MIMGELVSENIANEPKWQEPRVVQLRPQDHLDVLSSVPIPPAKLIVRLILLKRVDLKAMCLHDWFEKSGETLENGQGVGMVWISI